ncbi:Serine/threonine-protein kinase PAK mbt, partial [Orchesella cincta]
MFGKKKKKVLISQPTNFEHRVHTGYDKKEGKFIGLPPQWASIVGNNQILKSTNRPLPLVDPSEITHTEILDLKTVVRGEGTRLQDGTGGGIPKTSNVARSNSLRSSTPPQLRKNFRIPPSVPEEDPRHSQVSGTGYPPNAFNHAANSFNPGQIGNHHHTNSTTTGFFPHHHGSRPVEPHSPVPSSTIVAAENSNIFIRTQSTSLTYILGLSPLHYV